MLPTTRWHGTMMLIGLRPFAAPTARDFRASPSRRGLLAVGDGLRRTGWCAAPATPAAGSRCPPGRAAGRTRCRSPAKYSLQLLVRPRPAPRRRRVRLPSVAERHASVAFVRPQHRAQAAQPSRPASARRPACPWWSMLSAFIRRLLHRLAHRWCSAYERHGRQRSASASAPLGDPSTPSEVERVAHAEVGGQEDVGIAERPHGDVAGRPRTDAAQGLQRLRPSPRGRCRRRARCVPSATWAHASMSAAPRDRRHGEVRGAEAGDRLGRREHVRDRRRPGSRAARRAAATSRAASVRAPATLTCWPSTARTSSSVPSGCPGARRPGRFATSGASSGSAAEMVVDGRRVAVEVEQPAGALHRGLHVGDVVEHQRARHGPIGDRSRTRRRCPSPDAASGGRRRRRRSRCRARLERPGTRAGASPSNGSRQARRTVSGSAGCTGDFAARSCVGLAAYTSRTVSLNWRTLWKPLANATSVIGSVVVSMRMRAVCARCARASASGPEPTSATSSRLHLPLAVAEAGGERRRRPHGRRVRRR